MEREVLQGGVERQRIGRTDLQDEGGIIYKVEMGYCTGFRGNLLQGGTSIGCTSKLTDFVF